MNPQEAQPPRPNAPHSARILLLVAGLMGVAMYAADALIEAALHHHGELVDQLIRPDSAVLLIRLGVAGLFLALGWAAYLLLRRERSGAEHLRMAESFLSSVVDNIPDMVFIKDARELRFVRVNPAAERLVGLSADELIGKSDYDFFPEAQADFFTGKDRDVLSSKRVLDIPEEEIDTRHMGRRLLHTKKVPILDYEGRPAFLLGVSEDITERRHAELAAQVEKARAEHYLEISRSMIVGLDREGRVNLINPRGCEILGWAEAEILGRNWFDTVLPDKIRARERELARDLLDGHARPEGVYEGEVVTRAGQVRQIAWNVALQSGPKGEVVGTLRSGQDVTDRVMAELEAQRHHQELAHVMRLSTMGEMASGLAHELNQPLTAVMTYCAAAMVLLDRQPASQEAVRGTLEKATEQARRAGDIIRRLRGLVKKGDSRQQLIRIDGLITEAIAFLEWELRQSAIDLELRLNGGDRPVRADPVQIEQVLINLIRNGLDSIRAGAVAGGRIEVETEVTDQATLRLRVRDNGPGIDPYVLARLFEPFLTTKRKGLGIGLSISRSIIEAHGGSLWGENEPEGGSVFGFELPLAAEEEQRGEAERLDGR
jgi:two-component system sensor kinase FixL